MPFRIEGLEVIDGSDPRVTVHRLHDGSTLAVATPPTRGDMIPEETHLAAVPVRKAANAFAALNSALKEAQADKTLSDIGREQKTKGPRDAARRAVAEAETEIAALETKLAGLHAEAYAPPKLERADVEGALVDQEIRAYARGMTSKERTEFLETISASPRHLEAIMRSPIPFPVISDHASQLWRQARQNSPAAVKAQGMAEALDWARGSLATLKRKI